MRLQNKVATILMMGILILPSAKAEISGMLTVRRQYNRNHYLTQVDYVDANGQVTTAEDKGYATVCYRYDQRNKLTEMAYYNAEGELVNGDEGYARLTQSWNAKRKLLRKAYYLADGSLFIGPEGFAIQENTYEGTTLMKTAHYGADGLPLHSETLYTYYVNNRYRPENSRRSITPSQEYTDADGNLMAGPQGWARVENGYINEQYLCSTAYYGADGNLFFNEALGYARMEKVYRNYRFREAYYYDENNKPVLVTPSRRPQIGTLPGMDSSVPDL